MRLMGVMHGGTLDSCTVGFAQGVGAPANLLVPRFVRSSATARLHPPG